MNKRPVAVIIGDIHFTPNTLDLASTALSMAQKVAVELDVPLIINGDTLDSKDVIRGVCANRLIKLFEFDFDIHRFPTTYINIGNHEKINEKSDDHSLHFLKRYIYVVSSPAKVNGFWIVPYMSSPELFKEFLRTGPTPGDTLIVHQGVTTANLGHYVQDLTAIPKELFADFRVIGSHYHSRQDIQCGPSKPGMVGTFSYIGNPYTLTWSEANDLPKGFVVLHADGTLSHIPTNLRKHVIIDVKIENLPDIMESIGTLGDLHWVKVRGPASELQIITKKLIADKFFGHSNFKLDLIPDLSDTTQTDVSNVSGEEILNNLINELQETDTQKQHLKALYKALLEDK